MRRQGRYDTATTGLGSFVACVHVRVRVCATCLLLFQWGHAGIQRTRENTFVWGLATLQMLETLSQTRGPLSYVVSMHTHRVLRTRHQLSVSTPPQKEGRPTSIGVIGVGGLDMCHRT